MSSLSTSLKNSYDRWLNPYEHYLRQAKPGVYQQLEYEYGGPLTPSPAPSPLKRSTVNTPSSLRGESPARHATDALQASFGVCRAEGDRDVVTAPDLPSSTPHPTTSGFTAVNSGGFTAVNASFTSVNRPTPPEIKSFTPPPRRHDSPASLTKDVLDFRPSGLGPANALKRQLSFDSIDSVRKEAGADRDDSESGSRRSKRIRKGMSCSTTRNLRHCPSYYASAVSAGYYSLAGCNLGTCLSLNVSILSWNFSTLDVV